MSEDAKPNLNEMEDRYVQATNYRQVYSNSTRTSVTTWDISITFSTVVLVAPDQLVQDEVTVVLSPSHAKALLKNWAATIAKYEEVFGPVPDVTPPRSKEESSKVTRRLLSKAKTSSSTE